MFEILMSNSSPLDESAVSKIKQSFISSMKDEQTKTIQIEHCSTKGI
jgi:hypothetical protein